MKNKKNKKAVTVVSVILIVLILIAVAVISVQNRQPDVLLIPTAEIMVLSSAIRPTEKSKLASLTNRGICAMSAFPIPRSSWTNI